METEVTRAAVKAWFQHADIGEQVHLLLARVGNIPPGEADERYQAMISASAITA